MAENSTPPPPANNQPPNQQQSTPAQHAQPPSSIQIPPQVIAAMIAAQVQRGQPMQPQLIPAAMIQQGQHWQAPYPPPEAVERYEKVLPGTLNRLITMAEQLQAAQIEQSARSLEYTHSDSKRGHWLGFVTTGIAMIAALTAAWLGQTVVACVFLSVPVMAVAKALIEISKAPSSTELAKAVTSQPVSDAPSSSSNGIA